MGIEELSDTATKAATTWAAATPRVRATALVATSDALMAAERELVETAIAETGLSESRLTGELVRTVVQLKLFADVVLDGTYMDVRIDEADTGYVLGTRPDVRRYRVALGPVLNFAASNFPFAFSVAGGDTASALAAGCSVIVKAHSGHPQLSAQTARVASQALENAGAPEGILQIIKGQQAGIAMLKNPRIRAASFTGSIPVGRMLADIAAARPTPIPFYGELGSVNPVFVTRAAMDERSEAILDGFVTSVSGSAGQLCTKPGFMFMPTGIPVAQRIALRTKAVAEQRLLNPGIASGYDARRTAVVGAPGVTLISEGTLRLDEDGQGWATPTIVSVSIRELLDHREELLDESFGPLSIIVEYGPEDDLAKTAGSLFQGNLTGTVHTARGEDSKALRNLVGWISENSGRVIFDGWPTGVAVTPAMQHGGPYPATTNDTSTSVGTAAIARFTRPVAYQNVPQELLPEPLRDDNPWGVPQRRSPAGESFGWGDLQQPG